MCVCVLYANFYIGKINAIVAKCLSCKLSYLWKFFFLFLPFFHCLFFFFCFCFVLFYFYFLCVFLLLLCYMERKHVPHTQNTITNEQQQQLSSMIFISVIEKNTKEMNQKIVVFHLIPLNSICIYFYSMSMDGT